MDDLEKRFPHEVKFGKGEEREMNPDNHFTGRDVNDVRKKHLQFSVLMEYLNQVLELDRHVSVENFAIRIRDLIVAAHQGEQDIDRREEMEREIEKIKHEGAEMVS